MAEPEPVSTRSWLSQTTPPRATPPATINRKNTYIFHLWSVPESHVFRWIAITPSVCRALLAFRGKEHAQCPDLLAHEPSE
jgi:hypothetical protein